MKTRNFALCALGLAAAISIGSAGTASAQAAKATTTRKAASDTTKKRVTTRKPAPKKKITPGTSEVMVPKTKEQAMTVMKTDTVRVMVHDTVQMMGRVDTVVRTVERYRVDTMMQMLPKQRLPGLYFGLAGGIAVPINNFRDYIHDGLDVNASVGWFPKDGALGVRFDGNYAQFPGRESIKPLPQDAHNLSLSGDLVLRFPLDRTSHINPVIYFLGGGGFDHIANVTPFINSEGKCVTVNATAVKGCYGATTNETEGNKFDYNVGGGIQMNLWGAHLFSEARYTAIMANNGNIHYIPVLFGINFY